MSFLKGIIRWIWCTCWKRTLEISYLTYKSLEGASRNLSYLSSCSLSRRWSFWRIRSNVLRGIESDLAYTKVSVVTSQCILRSGSLWYPARSSMLKNKRDFLLIISKLMPAFSTVQIDVAENHINYYVTKITKNNTRSLGGVINRLAN